MKNYIISGTFAVGRIRKPHLAKWSLFGVAAICGALLASTGCAQNATNAPAWPPVVKGPPGAPNVVLVLLDDVGYGYSSVFGGPVPTPNIDKVASQGLR